MTNEELLKEAKRRYPVGTKFKCKHLSHLCEVTIDGTWDTVDIDNKPSVIFYPKESFGKYVYLEWLSTEWAEIVESPKQEEKSLVGRYVKCLKNNANGCRVNGEYVKKDNYYQIGNIKKQEYVLKDGNLCGYVDRPNSQFVELGFELMPIGWTPEQENAPQFEVGKWYKINNSWYAKFKAINNNEEYWRFSEKITNSKLHVYQENQFSNWKDITITLLIDLSEIQPYLPDNHPDKIIKQETNIIPKYVECIKSNNNNEFTVGKIYSIKDGRLTTNYNYHCESNLHPNLKNYYNNYDFKPSTKEAYEAQFSETPLTPKECISNNGIIEVGDEVKFIGYTNHNSKSKWYKPSEIFSKSDKGIIVTILDISEEDGGAYKVKTPTGYTALRRTAFELIKKASQTTTTYEKQVDSVSPQVNTEITTKSNKRDLFEKEEPIKELINTKIIKKQKRSLLV